MKIPDEEIPIIADPILPPLDESSVTPGSSASPVNSPIPVPTEMDEISLPRASSANVEPEALNDYEADTVVYVSPETYLYRLNNDQRYGKPDEDEMALLDRAFNYIDKDRELCKDLINGHLTTIIKPKSRVTSGKRTNEAPKNMSNRKRKREDYIKIQRLYRKNRKSAFDSLYNSNSISEELSSDVGFSFWSHLLTKTNTRDEQFMNMDNDLVEEDSPSFDSNRLIYPEEVRDVRTTGKTSAGLDGLSVYQTERISPRIRAKLFSLFLLLGWCPDVLMNSYTIFIPKKKDTNSPAKLRPISIASILLRQFHKILVKK